MQWNWIIETIGTLEQTLADDPVAPIRAHFDCQQKEKEQDSSDSLEV